MTGLPNPNPSIEGDAKAVEERVAEVEKAIADPATGDTLLSQEERLAALENNVVTFFRPIVREDSIAAGASITLGTDYQGILTVTIAEMHPNSACLVNASVNVRTGDGRAIRCRLTVDGDQEGVTFGQDLSPSIDGILSQNVGGTWAVQLANPGSHTFEIEAQRFDSGLEGIVSDDFGSMLTVAVVYGDPQ